jgi:choline monooxygenase
MEALPRLPDLTPDALEIRPLAQAETIPSSWYTDARFVPFERDAIFGRTWQYVGHRAQLPEAGAYVTDFVAGNPLLLVRDADGAVRAFYNVCRHRGGPLAMDERGCATMLQCKYHGWTYRLDGSLRGVPRFDRTELFDKRDYGLRPVPLEEWEGLLFVNLDGAGPSLAEVLDGIAERIAPLRLDGLQFHGRVAYDVGCNWKAYVDNFLEGYHIPLVHPELVKVLDYRAYLTETHSWYSLQHSPLRDRDGANPYGADGDAFYYFVFPNTMLNVLPGRLQVNRVAPVAADRCRVVFDYYYEDVASEEAQARIAADLAFSDDVQREDIAICEHVQRGLQSRGYDRGRFSVECEAGVHHFQGLLKAAFREALARAEAAVAANGHG